MSFMGYVEINVRDRQATDDDKTRPVHIACWIPKATDINPIYNNYRSSIATLVT